MANEKKPTRDDAITSIEGKLKDALSVDTKTGVITSPDTVYEDCLPEGLAIETVKQVHNHDHNFVAAGARVVSQMMHQAMVKTPELTSLTHSLPMEGRDSVAYTVNEHGLGVVLTTHAVNTNAGDLKKTAASIKELIREGKAK